MDIESLKLFVAVAQSSSFSKVARDNDMDPSSVSRAISIIEAELGVRLIQRTTRKMVLTEAGAAYFSRLKPLLEELDQAHEALVSSPHDPSGTLRLTASVGFGQHVIAPLVPKIRESFPRLQLELLFSDANLDFVADRIDLAIRLGSSYRADVIGSKLISTHFRVVASPDYLMKAGVPRVPADLGSHACLLFSIPDYRTRWLFRHDQKVEEVPIHGDIYTLSSLTLRDFALSGMGPSLLADWLINADLKSGKLIDLFPNYEVTATTFDTAAWLLYPSRKFLPNKVRAMIDFLRQHVTD